MKYIKGSQIYQLESLQTCKTNLICEGESEGIWVKQADNEIVLQNHSLFFFPFQSWGIILPSKYTIKTETQLREKIDISEIINKDITLTLHPEAWISYIEKGVIDENGEIISDNN